MTMPRLSLYRPNRTNDYQFLDRTIAEMYTVGGLDIFVHKYLGPQGAGTDNGNNFPFGLRRLGHGYFPVGEFALNEAGGSLHRWLKASRVRAACSGVVVR